MESDLLNLKVVSVSKVKPYVIEKSRFAIAVDLRTHIVNRLQRVYNVHLLDRTVLEYPCVVEEVIVPTVCVGSTLALTVTVRRVRCPTSVKVFRKGEDRFGILLSSRVLARLEAMLSNFTREDMAAGECTLALCEHDGKPQLLVVEGGELYKLSHRQLDVDIRQKAGILVDLQA